MTTETTPIEIMCPCCRARIGIEPFGDGYQIKSLDEWNDKPLTNERLRAIVDQIPLKDKP